MIKDSNTARNYSSPHYLVEGQHGVYLDGGYHGIDKPCWEGSDMVDQKVVDAVLAKDYEEDLDDGLTSESLAYCLEEQCELIHKLLVCPVEELDDLVNKIRGENREAFYERNIEDVECALYGETP